MVTALAILQAVAALAGLLRQYFVVKQSADDRQAGQAEAERDEAQAGRAAAEAELKASVDAPKDAEEAIRRLGDGTA